MGPSLRLAVLLLCLTIGSVRCQRPVSQSSFSLGIPSSLLSPEGASDDAPMVLETNGTKEEPAHAVPLRHREVRADLLADVGVASVTEIMQFQAPGSDIQATFKFPLPPSAAMYGFEASIEDRVIKTEVKEKEEAQATYEGAVQEGNSAVLLQQSSKSNIYTLSLGNFAAHESCTVKIKYLRLLSILSDALEWVHTSTWVPPYTGSARDQRLSNRKQNFAATPVIENKVSYSLSYEVCISSEAGIQSVQSREKIQVLGGTAEDGCQSIVKLSSEVSDPGRDFGLVVQLGSSGARAEPSLALQHVSRNESTKTVGLASFPALPRKDNSEGEASKTQATQLKQELFLVVDCSGSMEGTPRSFAYEAALYFVRDLPRDQGIKFNIVGYGSDFTSMVPEGSVDYNGKTYAQAVKWVDQELLTDMGGTEVSSALQWVYQQPIPEGYERTIIFMTDGAISPSEEDYVAELVSTQANHTTVMTIGIGYGVHGALLERMSSLTGGMTQYVQGNEDIVRSVGFLKESALSTDVLQQPKLTPKGCTLRTAPAVPPHLFVGQTLRVLLEVLDADPGASLELSAVRKDGTPVRMAVPIPSLNDDEQGERKQSKGARVSHVEGDSFAALHALACIGNLLEGRNHLHISPDGTSVDQYSEDLNRMAKQQVV